MKITHFVISAAALLMVAPANAAVVMVTGTTSNVSAPPGPGSCAAPALTLIINPADTVGHSNLGNFTFSQQHCVTPPLPAPYSGGIFSFFFDLGDTLTGSYAGMTSLSGVPGVLNNSLTYTATGGTGRFVGASGTIDLIGTITFAAGRPPRGDSNLSGTLNLPAVPEPMTWMLLLTGFSLVGAKLRWVRQRSQVVRYAGIS